MKEIIFFPNWGKWTNFGPQVSFFELFSKSVLLKLYLVMVLIIVLDHYNNVFLKLYLMTGIKKWFKGNVLDFYGKFFLSPKRVDRAFLTPKSILYKFSLNLFIRFFWNCTWWQALKSGVKWLLWIYTSNHMFGRAIWYKLSECIFGIHLGNFKIFKN